MANLAIKGHSTRGNEVIKILEMLGGNNKYHINITEWNLLYTIRESDNVIIGTYPNSSISQIYTIEEFLEKFPYKVGDKVYNIIHNENQTITNMFWDVHENEIIYQTINNEYVYVNYLQPYKEETMEKGIIYDEIDFNRCPHADKVELILGDNYEIQVAEGKTYVVKKKPQYPKTFIEVLNFWHPNRQLEDDYQRCYKKDLIEKFQDLLYARDAYWKMAGDWKPDITNDEVKFVIAYCCGNVYTTMTTNFNRVLVFPTEEMRDAFYDNFKDLIEECKELL